MPEFYMIFARKVSEFYVIIARKIFFPDFLGGPPVSYAYARQFLFANHYPHQK